MARTLLLHKCLAARNPKLTLDVIEALAYVLQLVAEDRPEIILELSRRQDLPPDPYLAHITWSLWGAALARHRRSLPTPEIEARVVELANHPNEFVRFASAEGRKALNI